MSIVVGVDAGGTSTAVVAADGERVLGEFVGDAANVRITGIEAAADTIARAAGAALDGATPDALFVGAAGVGRDDLAYTLERALRMRMPRARIAVSEDTRIALRASVPEGDGMVLISGTGSIAYAEIGEHRYRSGGYGYLLGDEGSAFALSAAALRATLRSYDGRGPRDSLVEAVEAHVGAGDAQAMLAALYDGPSPVRRIAALAPVVLARAGEGDRSAMKIVQNAALELFDLVRAVVRAGNLHEREFPLVFSGGLLQSNSLLTYLLETRVSNELPLVRICKGGPAPQYGALALARELLALV